MNNPLCNHNKVTSSQFGSSMWCHECNQEVDIPSKYWKEKDITGAILNDGKCPACLSNNLKRTVGSDYAAHQIVITHECMDCGATSIS